MTRAAPAIPLFGDAYIADTRHLSLEEHGAYLQLLMIAWRTEDCSLPDDDKRIAQMLGVTAKKWATIKPAVMAFWTLEKGRWTQKRLSKERRFVAKKSEDNRAAAKARWNSKSLENNDAADADAMPDACLNDAPPPPPTYSDTNVSGDESPIDPVKVMFDAGIILLAGSGLTAKAARALIGKWRRDNGDDPVRLAIAEAQAARISDPVPWIEARFSRRGKPLPDNRLPGEPIPMWKHQRQERERATAAGGGR